jgi:hypothetical protein
LLLFHQLCRSQLRGRPSQAQTIHKLLDLRCFKRAFTSKVLANRKRRDGVDDGKGLHRVQSHVVVSSGSVILLRRHGAAQHSSAREKLLVWYLLLLLPDEG